MWKYNARLDSESLNLLAMKGIYGADSSKTIVRSRIDGISHSGVRATILFHAPPGVKKRSSKFLAGPCDSWFTDAQPGTPAFYEDSR